MPTSERNKDQQILVPLKCSTCGAGLDSAFHCEFCGTNYRVIQEGVALVLENDTKIPLGSNRDEEVDKILFEHLHFQVTRHQIASTQVLRANGNEISVFTQNPVDQSWNPRLNIRAGGDNDYYLNPEDHSKPQVNISWNYERNGNRMYHVSAYVDMYNRTDLTVQENTKIYGDNYYLPRYIRGKDALAQDKIIQGVAVAVVDNTLWLKRHLEEEKIKMEEKRHREEQRRQNPRKIFGFIKI